ncbi:MAG: transglutaminase-like domain-containing protein [Eubacteriales bacterium]|nr:transglutaminase-like domain-containing protein [Eubacteriales bacterium]
MEKRSAVKRLQQGIAGLLLLGFLCLTACAGSSPAAQSGAETGSNTVPAVQAVDSNNKESGEKMLLPEASGTIRYEGNGVTIDASHTDQGYVMVRCEPSEKRLKARVSTPAQTYYYDLPGGETYSVFPLQMGDGVYTVRVMEQVEDDLYAMRYGTDIDVRLGDETLPFLYPNQYVWYDETTQTVQKAEELAAGLSSDEAIVKQFYRFVVQHMTYDTQKAATVQRGYLPNADESLKTGKGICFDYAALFAVMLRSKGIPAKMMIGTVTPENLYHSWNSVFLDGEWVWMDPTLDGTGHRESDYITERIY